MKDKLFNLNTTKTIKQSKIQQVIIQKNNTLEIWFQKLFPHNT